MPSPSSQLLQKCLKGLEEEAGRGIGPFPKTRVICFLLISIAPFCPVPPLSQTPGIKLLLHYLINFSWFWDSKSSSPFHRWGPRSSQSLGSFYYLPLYSPGPHVNRCVMYVTKAPGKFPDARQCRLLSGPQSTATPPLTRGKTFNGSGYSTGCQTHAPLSAAHPLDVSTSRAFHFKGKCQISGKFVLLPQSVGVHSV